MRAKCRALQDVKIQSNKTRQSVTSCSRKEIKWRFLKKCWLFGFLLVYNLDA